MRVLLIKTSSMGDIIHTFPALTDAARAIPDIQFDWVVEEAFAEIPAWHERVEKVIPIALRRWRKNLGAKKTWKEMRHAQKILRGESYDLIIDAQGLIKSAFLSLFTRGERAGLDWGSARESFASLFYQKKCTVNFYQHAVVRMRQIFSRLLNYSYTDTTPDYGLHRSDFLAEDPQRYLVFLHGTTWSTKLWPESYWLELAKLAEKRGFSVKITAGNSAEFARATRLAEACENVTLLPNLSIRKAATLIANAEAVVSLDTGFSHLAAALAVPNVSLYGPTNPELTGALGSSQICLSAQFPCAPCLNRVCTFQGESKVEPACFSTLPPQIVWEEVRKILA